MIDLYTAGTPNGRKVSILLEELELPYTIHSVDLRAGDQKKPEFLAINPNGKIPAITDREGSGELITVFESGAILIYLAEKAGRLLPRAGQERYTVLEWLFFQMSAVGPIFGQAYHFQTASETIPYALQRFTQESLRILGVIEQRLERSEFLAGAYSIADIATFPWMETFLPRVKEQAGDLPNVRRWLEAIGARPAVQRGMRIP